MKKEALKSLLIYMKAQLISSTISSKRNAGDFVADRITQAATKPTLLEFVERFGEIMGSGASVYAETMQKFMSVSTGHHANSMLLALRRYPKIFSQMLFVSAKREDGATSVFDAMLDSVDVEQLVTDASSDDDSVGVSPAWEIPMTVTCLSPLAHGGDNKSGNATLFRRMDVLGKNGSILSLPFYAGNAVRGQIRDLLADHFLSALGKPKLSLWFFHALYSGGALEEGGAKALAKKMGDNGAFKVEGMREFRDMLPALSLLGSAAGNRIISGRVMVGDLRPRCKQWGTGHSDVSALFDWQFLTRRDDNAENRAADDEHRGMIANTETLKTGTILDGGVSLSDHASELERSALELGLMLLRGRGFLGAENRRGFGSVKVEFGQHMKQGEYSSFLHDKKDNITKYLVDIGAIECTPAT